ncbi:hypothetical protein V2J09_016820 [Rumex salicifolius]
MGSFHILFLITNLLLLHISMSYGNENDIACLKSIKDTIEDPKGSLSSWDFSDDELEGFMCNFDGIRCWNDLENRVLMISLAGKGLRGALPQGLVNCTSLTALDLSSNHLFGEIPSDISKLVPFVTTLDLSSNSFSGEIPRDLSNCIFLNELLLNENQFSGQVPADIGSLTRLKTFSVAKNDLVGLVPMSIGSRFPAESFANNEMLCVSPLAPCRPLAPRTPLIHTPEFLAGAAISGVIFSASSFAIGIYLFICQVPSSTSRGGAEGNKCAKRIRWNRIKVSKSKSSLTDSEFRELARATDKFSKAHIIGFGKERTITLYRAALKNGKLCTVKRLQYTDRLLKECRLKMATMGSVRHPNLVPLLGYCVVNEELFLVYDHMPHGSLYDQLNSSAKNCSIGDWPLIRLKIAVAAANGLAWLHHYCNPRIIHQNISSRCVLLDADFIPKISDFGLVTIKYPINEHSCNFVKTERGDSGYLAPEHGRTQISNPKRDVYSFGVVLLELITGEMLNHVEKDRDGFNGSLVEWVMQLSNNSNLEEAVDRQLIGKGFDDKLVEFLRIACTCLALEPSDRPSMYQVHRVLAATLDRHHIIPQADALLTSDACEVDDEV